jgi:HAD superfamily hydrolase (TIGR01509 family)
MKILLLDIMDTVVRDPFATEEPAFFGLTLKELQRQKDPTAWVEFELGEIDEAEYFRRFFADRRPVDGLGLKATFRRAYRWVEGMEELLQDLRARGFQIHALSNYPPWYRLIDEALNVNRYLQWSFVSCHTGVRKPTPRAYLGAAEALGVAPAECLFIDDRQLNCDAAEAVGMPAVRFTDAGALRRALQDVR